MLLATLTHFHQSSANPVSDAQQCPSFLASVDPGSWFARRTPLKPAPALDAAGIAAFVAHLSGTRYER